MRVYIVGDHGPEHSIIHSIHRTYAGALKSWNKARLRLLRSAKAYLEHDKSEEMWQRIVKSLSCNTAVFNKPF